MKPGAVQLAVTMWSPTTRSSMNAWGELLEEGNLRSPAWSMRTRRHRVLPNGALA